MVTGRPPNDPAQASMLSRANRLPLRKLDSSPLSEYSRAFTSTSRAASLIFCNPYDWFVNLSGPLDRHAGLPRNTFRWLIVLEYAHGIEHCLEPQAISCWQGLEPRASRVRAHRGVPCKEILLVKQVLCLMGIPGPHPQFPRARDRGPAAHLENARAAMRVTWKAVLVLIALISAVFASLYLLS